METYIVWILLGFAGLLLLALGIAASTRWVFRIYFKEKQEYLKRHLQSALPQEGRKEDE